MEFIAGEFALILRLLAPGMHEHILPAAAQHEAMAHAGETALPHAGIIRSVLGLAKISGRHRPQLLTQAFHIGAKMICAGLRWRTGGRRAHIQRREIQFKAGALNGHGGSTQGKAQMRDASTFA